MPESLYYLFLSGLILGSGPCLGFCAPILSGFIAAYKPSFKKAVIAYLFFSSAKTCSYVVIGALSGVFSGALRSVVFSGYLNAVNMLLGIFVFFIGALTVVSGDPLKNRYCAAITKGNLRNAGVLGFLAGFAPCLPLLGILNYIVIISRSPFEGAFYAFIFGLGTAVSPVILLAGLSGKLAGDFSGNAKIKAGIRVIAGLILIFLGLRIVFQGAVFYQLTR